VEKTRRKVRPIARKRHNYLYLLLAILFAITTGYIFINFPPYHKFTIANFGIPILPIFFTSLGLLIFSLSTFLFIQKYHGVVITLLFSGYMLMRLIGLTHWLFFVLILGLFITIELFILKRK